MTDDTGSADSPTTPRRRRIVAGAVAGVVLVGGAGLATALAVGGDDDAPARPRASADASPSATDLGGPTVTGNGYRLQVPRGWVEDTAGFAATNPGLATLDRVVAWGPSATDARANVVVETQAAEGATDPEPLAAAWKRTLTRDVPGAVLADGAETTIGGRRALTVTITRSNAGGVTIAQRSHLVVAGTIGYSITLSAGADDAAAVAAFDDILGTWSWGVGPA